MKEEILSLEKELILDMEIRQFEDKHLAHYGYAVVSEGEMAVIDPGRDPRPYFDHARAVNARIVAILETHPHADFVSSHLEMHKVTGAPIYVSRLLDAEYDHQGFDEGDSIRVGKITLRSMNTPGHSPDSISILALDSREQPHAVFTGDTLFIGDCGRPDLREKAGAITAARAELARQMYHSLREKLLVLPDDVLVFPAHGAGSLCGKSLSDQNRSTMGAEKLANWSLQPIIEQDFIIQLLTDQPFIPRYFPFDVGLNKKGAAGFEESVAAVKIGMTIDSQNAAESLKPGVLVIDARPADSDRHYFPGAINLLFGNSFETWLGSLVNPGEPFYLLAENDRILRRLINRTASIGYEKQIVSAHVASPGRKTTDTFDPEGLRNNPEDYTILDVRNESERKQRIIFPGSLSIPLYELRERVQEIPVNKPIVVHCAGGYRSAAAASIVRNALNSSTPVYDLSVAVEKF